MADRSYKKDDHGNTFGAALLVAGSVQDLTGASAQFKMFRAGEKFIDAEATIDDPTNGHFLYTFAEGDLDTPGKFKAEVEITFNDGDVVTWPDEGYWEIIVRKDTDTLAAEAA